ncbi:MAG: SGNH/GDSL hydrolase family protein [Cognatishimia sp.]
MNLRLIFLFLLTFTLSSCVSTSTRQDVSRHDLRILTMGDSMMAAHRISGRAISDSVARHLNNPVNDRSVLGARMLYALPITGSMGLNISQQFRGGSWDWVIVNGGGNDLWLGCGCNICDRKMNKMITRDGQYGVIPDLVSRIRATGAQVLWLGYLRSPGVGSPIEGCREEGNALENRIIALSAQTAGMHYMSLADLVPYGDRSYHGIDMIHPSLKASAEIGARAAAIIRHLSFRE